MADQRKVKVLDSYQTLKAIRTAAGAEDASPPPAADAPGSPPSKRKTRSAGSRTRTVVPTKQVIICYECGYTFQLHGRAKRVPCSKCRADLDLTDHAITGRWSQPLKTAASIHIKPDAVVQSGDLVGKRVILDGQIEAGHVLALERLEVGAGAKFPEQAISAPELKIGAGAEITFQQPVNYRDLEILGALHARVLVTGHVTIRAGGLLEGELTTGHLRVEEGGGLRAQVNVTRTELKE